MWLNLLTAAVAASNKTQVAAALDVSRTAISLVMSGKYPASTDKIAARVIETYGRVICPHLVAEITLAQCKRHHTSQAPTSSPRAMKHWRACQSCQHNQANQSRSKS